MADRAIVTHYGLAGDETGLFLTTQVSFVRDGGSGVESPTLSVPILASDTVNQIGVKVIAAVKGWAAANTYDVDGTGQILLPSYSKNP